MLKYNIIMYNGSKWEKLNKLLIIYYTDVATQNRLLYNGIIILILIFLYNIIKRRL